MPAEELNRSKETCACVRISLCPALRRGEIRELKDQERAAHFPSLVEERSRLTDDAALSEVGEMRLADLATERACVWSIVGD